MTGPDPTTEILRDLRRDVREQGAMLTEIARSVRGDPQNNLPSMRDTIKSTRDEFKSETLTNNDRLKELGDRQEAIEQKIRDFESYLRFVTTQGKWLFGTSLSTLITVVGVIIALIKGVHP